MDRSKSEARGAQKDVEEKTPLESLSTKEVKTANTLDTLESSVSQTSQVGFQPTKALGEPEETTNARLIVTFAAKLGTLVSWHKVETPNGEVFALYFPLDKWATNAAGELVAKDEQTS